MKASGARVVRGAARIAALLSVLYALAIWVWFLTQLVARDRVWWLALVSAFAPLFIVPLVLLLPLGLLIRERACLASVVATSVVFVALYGVYFLPQFPPPIAKVDRQLLTVMSFNIWGGSVGDETARAIVRNGVQPDVVALQELNSEMADVLRDELGTIYPYQDLEDNGGTWGAGLLSRYPIRELDATHLNDAAWPEASVLVFEIEVPGALITLYNVHLPSSHLLVYLEEGRSVPDAVRASFRKRETIVDLLLEDIASRTTPVVVAGDFNTTDQSAAYRMLSTALCDAHHAAGWGFGHSFPAYAGSYRGIPILPRQMRIDMVWSSAELPAVACRVGSSYGESDHRPVIAQLALAASTP